MTQVTSRAWLWRSGAARLLVLYAILMATCPFWLGVGLVLSPLLLVGWFLRKQRGAPTWHMTALGIGLAFMTLLPLGRVVPVGQRLLLPLIPVEGTGTYRAAFFAIHATLIGAPAALLLHYRYGIRPALLFALGFLAPLVSWAFWDIGYGLPFISPLVTWPLEALLPGTLALVLARAAAVVEGSSRADGLVRVTVAAALMTASALALSGIVAQRWLPPRTQLSYSASFGPAYLLVYGLAVAVLFLPILTWRQPLFREEPA